MHHEKRKQSPQKTNNSAPVPPQGGKVVPPSVLAMQNKALAAAKSQAIASASKNVVKVQAKKQQPPPSASKSKESKRKSIFSPDNSSESDDDKSSPVKGERRSSNGSNGGGAGRGRGRPRKYPIPSKAPVQKQPPKSTEKKTELKKEATSASSTTDSTASSNSESDSESAASETKPSRKSARQSSVRKSKHLVKSETETDDSTKRSATKSPVKKVPSLIPTKGKSKHKKIEQKHNLNLSKDSQPEEKGCPFESCHSMGHLSGKFDNHFTLEACPMYHNLSISESKQILYERKKRADERMKALDEYEPKKPATNEQKTYLQKIRDLRIKFKPISNKMSEENRHDEKEPNLSGIVSDYDLQLFRDAQALASENIENELKQLPCQGSVKFLVMGKHIMEVWYQSVYPEDVQRLPKLWLCEFCLRYQKSEVGMKRHAAKCVWRHPPGGKNFKLLKSIF